MRECRSRFQLRTASEDSLPVERTGNEFKCTKDSIVGYVAGDSVVDVGSGGGILLDKLEARFPDKKVIGTDISTPDNLGKYLELLDEKGEVTEYPDSNCIIVAQKQ